MELTAQVLRSLGKMSHPNLLVDAEHFDDAGVYRLNESTAIVQTVDFFPPLVDDPFTFGRIAASNALSDVYAMGGTPITALNIVGFPDKELPGEILVEILKGGQERVAAADAVLIGGHSVRDAEIKYGLAVTGTVHPDRIATNGGAQVGDRLVLTKPIGSGVLTSAAKQGKLPVADLAEAIDVMVGLNRAAADAMMKVGAHAATDVTGFGLLGHAFEMATASGVSLVIDSGSVPLLAETMRFASEGILTRAHKGTLGHLGDRLATGDVDGTLVGVLADAQTSGGMLVAVAPDRVEELQLELRASDAHASAVIGEVVTQTSASILLR